MHISAQAWIWICVGVSIACFSAILLIDAYEVRQERKLRNEPDEHTQGGIG